ncbi:MAG: TolC family protein [Clostridiaceae bacterium]
MKKKMALTTAALMGIGTIIPAASVMAAAPVANGWGMEYGIWYYYNNSVKVKNGWARDSRGWCFLSTIDGSWLREGWAQDSKGWCYIRNGYWVGHATWARDTEGWQYIGPDGYWVRSVAAKNENPIEVATDAVVKVESSRLLSEYDIAKDKVDELNSAIPEKSDLLSRLAYVKSRSKELDNTFDYSDIDELILENNNTVQSLRNTREKLELGQDMLDETKEGLESTIKAIDVTVPADVTVSDAATADVKMLCDEINSIYAGMRADKASKIASLKAQVDSLDSQQEDYSISRNQLIVQTHMAEDQLISAGEKLITGYKSLELQETKIDENLDILERNYDMMKLYKEQGMITDLDLRKAQLSLDTLKYSGSTIKTQKSNMIRQLNLLIGEPYDDTAEVIFDTSLVDELDLSDMDKYDDLDEAMANNYNIDIKRYAVELSQNAYDSASGSSEDSAELDLENAKLAYQDTKRAEELKFIQAYDAVTDKRDALKLQQSTLAIEKTNLDTAYLKYSLGMISEKAWKDAEATYKVQQAAAEISKMDLFNAYRTYQWMMEGLSN